MTYLLLNSILVSLFFSFFALIDVFIYFCLFLFGLVSLLFAFFSPLIDVCFLVFHLFMKK